MPYFLHGNDSIICVRLLGFCSFPPPCLQATFVVSCFQGSFPSDLALQFLGLAAFAAFTAFAALIVLWFALSLFLFFSFSLCLLSFTLSVCFVQAISESESMLLIFIFLTPFPLPFPVGVLILWGTNDGLS